MNRIDREYLSPLIADRLREIYNTQKVELSQCLVGGFFDLTPVVADNLIDILESLDKEELLHYLNILDNLPIALEVMRTQYGKGVYDEKMANKEEMLYYLNSINDEELPLEILSSLNKTKEYSELIRDKISFIFKKTRAVNYDKFLGNLGFSTIIGFFILFWLSKHFTQFEVNGLKDALKYTGGFLYLVCTIDYLCNKYINIPKFEARIKERFNIK